MIGVELRATGSCGLGATRIYVVTTYVDGTYATLASPNTAVSATIRSRPDIRRLAGVPHTHAEVSSAEFASYVGTTGKRGPQSASAMK
jgi:hypothetical protein